METNVISSLNLNLNSIESSIGYSTDHNSCKRTIRAPESHSFLVRLQHNPAIKNNKIGKQYFEQDLAKTRNSTISCPLSIVSIIKIITFFSLIYVFIYLKKKK